jgi:LysM repeat protein
MNQTEKTILAFFGLLAAVALGITGSLVYQTYAKQAPLPTAASPVARVTTTDLATAKVVEATTTLAGTESASLFVTFGPTQDVTATDTVTPVLAIINVTYTVTPTVEPTQPSIYVVKSGDVLFNIALHFHVSVDELKAVNDLEDNTIYVGQELVLPIPGQVLPTRTFAPPTITLAPGTPVPTNPPVPTSTPIPAGPTPGIALNSGFGQGPIPGPSPTWSVMAFPTRFPATGPTKLGLHVTLNMGGALDYVAAVHPPVMKGVDDVGYLKDVKALSPNTVTIGRFVVDQPNIGEGDPAQRALDFVNTMLPKYQANPWVDYWEGWNEVTYPNYAWYATFEATRACEMQRLGFKAAIGGFSTGTPEPWQFEAFIPAIEAGIRCGAILTTHEYGAPTMYLWWSQGLPESYGNPAMPAYADRGPLIGRYRYLYYNILLPRGLRIPLVISETGIDGGAGAGQRPGYSDAQGWMGFASYWGKELGQPDPAQFYVDQLAWYDSMLRQDSFVIGATIFNIGNGGTWASFDMSPVIPKLTDYALSLH